MAMLPDGTAEKDSVSTELPVDGNAEVPVPPDSVTDQNSIDDTTVFEDDSVVFGDVASSDDSERAGVGSATDPVSDADAAEVAAPVVAASAESDGSIVSTEQHDNVRSSDDDAEDIEDSGPDSNLDLVGHDRSEEVPNLLGRVAISDNEESEIMSHQVSEDEDTFPEDGVTAEDGTDKSASTISSIHDQSDKPPAPTIAAELEITEAEHPDVGGELTSILESLQDSAANIQYISSKIDTVSSDTVNLVEQVNGISQNYMMLTTEIESISSGTAVKNVLSKTFLTIASVVMVSLVVIQIYMFISLNKIQRLQNSAGSSVLEQISSLNKKMADYDKNITKALEKPVQQEHTQPNNPAEKIDLKAHENNNISSANAAPVHERLNKLRNGLPEKKLIRKETGDWFIYNKKSNECISDVEVIQALNEAYRKIGRSLSTSIPLPPINALCILKPDGKGGTQIVMTEKFVP